MKSGLKLNEIIWEITGKCKNGCSYCGSREEWYKPVNNELILKIAQEIANFPPKAIDISGGDPLLVDFEIHKELVRILKEKGVECKILINPKSYRGMDNYDLIAERFELLSLYDWIGISLNDEEEIELWKEKVGIVKNCTIISNFNDGNIHLFDKIAECVTLTESKNWQVQLTMNEVGAQINDANFDILSAKINGVHGINIIVADNMNEGSCWAGTSSIGILSTGDIVPCLSMRSWCARNIDIQGNIFEGLGKIWREKFTAYRFEDFVCCKDHCKRCFKKVARNERTANKNGDIMPPIPEELTRRYVYGVTRNAPREYGSGQIVYGVGMGPPVVTVYAVQSPNSGRPDFDYPRTYTNDTSNGSVQPLITVHDIEQFLEEQVTRT